jgi:hypothetical protein
MLPDGVIEVNKNVDALDMHEQKLFVTGSVFD